MAVLVVLYIDYEQYNEGAKYISYLLTPATVCLAVPLYEQLSLLKKNFKAVAAGIICGVLASLVSVLGLSILFGLTHEQYVTLLPKSITTAIGMGISEELGGIVTITVASIIITGILGNVMAEFVCKIFKILTSHCKGAGPWNCISRYWNRKSYGNGAGRRSYEQSGYCSGRAFDCGWSLCVCRNAVKGHVNLIEFFRIPLFAFVVYKLLESYAEKVHFPYPIEILFLNLCGSSISHLFVLIFI